MSFIRGFDAWLIFLWLLIHLILLSCTQRIHRKEIKYLLCSTSVVRLPIVRYLKCLLKKRHFRHLSIPVLVRWLSRELSVFSFEGILIFISLYFPFHLQKEKHKRTGSQDSMKQQSNAVIPVQSKRKRRLTIPEKPNYSLNLWSIMKNCIGKELTKIPMPVSNTSFHIMS